MRKNGDVRALRLEGGLFGLIGQGKWNAKAYYYDSERGIPGAIVNNVWKNSQRQWDKNFFVQGSWQKKFSSFYELMANAKYARDWMRYLNPDTTLMYINNKFTQHEIYVSTASKFTPVDNWDIDLSVDYQCNTLQASLVNFARPTRNSVLTALASAYTLGRLKAEASLLYTMANDRYSARNNGETVRHYSKYLNKFTPAVFVCYQPWEEPDLQVRAYYKRIFRMPTFNDLYYTDFGNASLKPEYATQYDLSLIHI